MVSEKRSYELFKLLNIEVLEKIRNEAHKHPLLKEEIVKGTYSVLGEDVVREIRESILTPIENVKYQVVAREAEKAIEINNETKLS